MRVSRDARLIYVAAFLRSTAVGVAGVILALVLGERGLSVSRIGLVMGAGIAGAAAMTAVVAPLERRFGRRLTLVGLAILTACGYATVVLPAPFIILVSAAGLGMLNGMGRDRGPAAALEQAMLPETTDASHRTWVLACYNITLDVGHAIGALGGAGPTLLAAAGGMRSQVAHQVTLLMLAGLVAASAVPYALLSLGQQPGSGSVERETPPPVDAHTRRVVGRLALLFGLDSLGGGFLSASLVAYWFFHQFGVAERDIAFVFFAARALNAVSHLGAAWLARRVGLLNTMVFTHLPSSLFLMAAPSAPGVWLAVTLFLAREALVEMDVPTRQSYVMAIVPPAHRTFASGVTNFARTTTWAVGSAGAGFVMQHVLLAGPLLIGGILKIGYDLLLYSSFRAIKPPEEVSWRPSC